MQYVSILSRFVTSPWALRIFLRWVLVEISKSKGRNTEQRIIAIHMTDAQPQGVVAAEYLRCIEEIAVAVWGDIEVGKCHEHHLAGIHHGGVVRVGDC